MHIIMVTNVVAPDKLGGLERYVRELSRELVLQGQKVTVISKRTAPTQPDEEEFPDGVNVMRYRVPSKADPFFAVKYPFKVMGGVNRCLRRAMTRQSPGATVIHGHFPVSTLYLALGRIPYVYTCHAPVYQELLDERRDSYRLPKMVQGAMVAALRAAERLVLTSALRVITLSGFVSHEVTGLTGKNAGTPVRIPGGLDTSWFTPQSESHHDKPRRGPLLFTARRLVLRTGVDELLRSMPLILAQEPDASLAIAGDGPLKRQLQGIVDDLNIGHAVSFLGRITDVELRGWYQRADIAVTPTRNLEGFGLSTVEAMACGTVPLVTPVAANPEIAGAVSHLLVAPSADALGLAEGVLRLWNSSEINSLSSTVRGAVHPSLSWPVVGREHLNLYRTLAAGPPSKIRRSPLMQVLASTRV